MEQNEFNLDHFSVMEQYGEDLTSKVYVTNPAIAREEEIKRLMLVLMTPEKSALLIGKPGIGKTAIVEGLAYLVQNHQVPDVLKNYRIVKISSTALLGSVQIQGKSELMIQLLVDELKACEKTILFIDEIHTLIGGRDDGPMDLANILKPGLDRGDIKMIGATTTNEYDTYIIRDRAFLRRFERIDVTEPDEKTTIKILLESLPKIEQQTGIRMKYNAYVNELLMESIVSATSEFKRIYGLSAMYPDVAFSVLTGAFSQALLQNKKEVDLSDVYQAILFSKRIYPDSIVKELTAFRDKFAKLAEQEGIVFPIITIDQIPTNDEIY